MLGEGIWKAGLRLRKKKEIVSNKGNREIFVMTKGCGVYCESINSEKIFLEKKSEEKKA